MILKHHNTDFKEFQGDCRAISEGFIGFQKVLMGFLERYRGVHKVSEGFKGTSGAARGFKRVSVYSRRFHGRS